MSESVGSSRPPSITTSEFPRFGPYLIIRPSGAGGMGRVQLALRIDGEMPDVCVLKRPHADERAPDQDARFEREARIAVRLSHENIVRTVRVEKIEGELCIAQEYVEGMNLARFMRQVGPQGLPTWAVAHIAREVAAALAYAHDFGGEEIVHRDVTPENVMLGSAGEVKLIDFGISRSRVDGTVTSLGMVVGRRAYLAPEVWAGAKADRRADVFALGVVIWEMLTARRLEELNEMSWRDRVPDPRTIRPEITDEVANVVLRALDPDPEQRLSSADVVRRALGVFVPADANLRESLARLMALHFNVERAQEIVGQQIEDARRTLRSFGTSKPSCRRSRGRMVVVGGLLLVSGVAILFGLRRVRSTGPSPRRTATASVSKSTEVARSAPGDAPAMKMLAPARGAERSAEMGRPRPTRDVARPPRSKKAESGPAADATQPELPEDFLRVAYEQFDRGNLPEALAGARRALAAGAGEQGHVLLGSIYMNQGDLKAAERELRTAVDMNPRDTEAARRLGDVRRARLEQGQ